MLANLLQAIGSVSWSFLLWRPSLRVSPVLWGSHSITIIMEPSSAAGPDSTPYGLSLISLGVITHPSHSGKTSSPPFGGLTAFLWHVASYLHLESPRASWWILTANQLPGISCSHQIKIRTRPKVVSGVPAGSSVPCSAKGKWMRLKFRGWEFWIWVCPTVPVLKGRNKSWSSVLRFSAQGLHCQWLCSEWLVIHVMGNSSSWWPMLLLASPPKTFISYQEILGPCMSGSLALRA